MTPSRRRLRAAFVAAAVLCVPSSGLANGFDLFGMGSRATAMGGAAVASASDYSAVYYNPAAMVLGPSTAGAGIFATANNVGINLSERPDGYGIPDLGTAGPAIGDEHLLNGRGAEDLGNSFFGFVGATSNLSIERLRLGFVALVPFAGSTTQLSVFNDERERLFTNELHWDLMGGRVEHAVVDFAAAYQVLDWLALGLGASFMPQARTRNYVYADNPAELDVIDLNVELSLGSRFRPMAGVLFTPGEELRFGVAFRDEQFLALTGSTKVEVRGFEGTEDFPFLQPLDLTIQYSPRQFVFGGALHRGPVVASFDMTYSVWSNYENHHGELAGFKDVFVPHLGVEYRPFEQHHFRAGFIYQPTPVGPQTGRTNYVDNDRIVASLGTGHHWPVGESIFRVSWHAQWHFLVPREETKDALDVPPGCTEGVTDICDEIEDDAINPATGLAWEGADGLQTGNPGFPGWSSGGWLANVGVEGTWEF